MKLHEINPEKRYVLTIDADLVQEDFNRITETLETKGLTNITVITGPAIEVKSDTRYWGIWVAPPDGKSDWVRNGGGDFLYYPSPVIATARIADLGWEHCEVREFTLGDLEQARQL